jgi:hypothetical protein
MLQGFPEISIFHGHQTRVVLLAIGDFRCAKPGAKRRKNEGQQNQYPK